MPNKPSFDALATHLAVLASGTRLEILHALRTPRPLSELRVAPSLTREGESEERPLSRQAVTRHLENLIEAGLVRRIKGTPGKSDLYVLNHERIFAIVDEMRSLSKLRSLQRAPAPSETVARDGERTAPLPPGPKLVVAYGRDEGVAFALQAGLGSRWRIGRAPECEVRLDYDPYLSSEHAVVLREPEGFLLQDAGSRNGTLLNWEPLSRGGTRSLEPGDIISVGRSILVFQAGQSR